MFVFPQFLFEEKENGLLCSNQPLYVPRQSEPYSEQKQQFQPWSVDPPLQQQPWTRQSEPPQLPQIPIMVSIL